MFIEIWQTLFSFGLFYVLIKYFVFKKLGNILDERAKKFNEMQILIDQFQINNNAANQKIKKILNEEIPLQQNEYIQEVLKELNNQFQEKLNEKKIEKAQENFEIKQEDLEKIKKLMQNKLRDIK